MFHENHQLITLYDIKLGLDENFYDIIFPQNHFKNPTKQIKKYEQDNRIYIKFVAKHLPYETRNASSSLLYLDFRKWNHFCFLTNSKLYVTVTSISLVEKYLNSFVEIKDKKEREEIILVFSSTTTDSERELLRYMLSRLFGFQILHQKGYLFINEKFQISYKSLIINKVKLEQVVEEISFLKENWLSTYNGLKVPYRYLPNLSESSVFHSQEKINDAINYGEITVLFNCGSAVRRNCHKLGIYSFHDERFINCLTFKTQKIISRILDINFKKVSTSSWKYIDPSILQDNNYNKLVQAYKTNNILYFDLEFVHNSIYLAGFSDNDNEYEYLWNDRSNQAFMVELLNYLELHQDKVVVYYCAELRKLKEYIRKLGMIVDSTIFANFVDLYVILKDFCSFRGAFNFKLKSIEKAFQKQGYIPTSYATLECSNGVDSIEMFNDFKLFRSQATKRKIIEYNTLGKISRMLTISLFLYIFIHV